MGRYPVVMSTMEDDFRAIGLLAEADDPTQPRDIPSPDPDTLAGLDDSEGDKSAHMAGAKQPKPKMGPDADDAEESGYDPDEDGGSAGAQKGGSGSYKKVAGGKEASLESKQYTTAGKQPMAGNKKNKGQKAAIAKGLKPVGKVGGMMKEGRFAKAATLIEEVGTLLRGVQIDEEIDQLLQSFRLVAENSALLADRLTDISDQFQVEELISQMEGLSKDAGEAIDIIEAELENGSEDEDEREAIAHSSDVAESNGSDRNPDEPYDIPSPAFKEQSEAVLNVMVTKLMDALELYDNTLSENDMGGMHGEMDEADDDDDGDDKEVHLHTKAKKVHVHHGHEASADSEGDDADAGDEDDQDPEHGEPDMGDEEDDDADMGDMGDDDESDHDTHSLMAKMKALKARREAMSGGRPSRGHEEDESY